MRTIITAMVALAGLGALTLGTPTAASAQGVYFDAPGVSIGVGPWYRHHYYDPYAYGYYSYDRPYWWHRHHYRWRDWD